MKTRAIILAGGAGTRLGTLTTKRTKPAVTYAGKYRIIDFTLSNCVNSKLFDVMIIAQYRPHSLIEHIGSGGPWDLNRDFTGGIRIYTPYTARSAMTSKPSGWFAGTADAIQQNFSFIKHNDPDLVMILSGDHIYKMDYSKMIEYHLSKNADVTIATIRVPLEEASRFGVVDVDEENQITSFIEKPEDPPNNLVNMGVYLFSTKILDEALWDDHIKQDSSHDFGKDVLPDLLKKGKKLFAYGFDDYWVDVGTIASYWKAQMELLKSAPPLDLYDRSWIIHTRTEERPPAKIHQNATIIDSMICDGCIVKENAVIRNCILSPGVVVESGAVIEESIILTDANIEENVIIRRSIIDKRVKIWQNAIIGDLSEDEQAITMIGKNSIVPENMSILPGAIIGADVIPEDYDAHVVQPGVHIQTRRLPYEI
jgi:glucose-1-phosphate adenylyltransferase